MDATSCIRGDAFGTKPVRLVCFAHAGGGASSFNSWTLRLREHADTLRVQLPGREDRAHEPPHQDLESALSEVLPTLLQLLAERPFVLYGRSLGALLAFETARSLARSGLTAQALFISSRRAPRCPLGRTPMWSLASDAFWKRVIDLGAATPRLAERPAFREHYERMMRADLRITDEYVFAGGEQLSIPIYAYASPDDPLVDRSELEAWRDHTQVESRVRIMGRGHFMGQEAVDVLLSDLTEVLRCSSRKGSHDTELL